MQRQMQSGALQRPLQCVQFYLQRISVQARSNQAQSHPSALHSVMGECCQLCCLPSAPSPSHTGGVPYTSFSCALSQEAQPAALQPAAAAALQPVNAEENAALRMQLAAALLQLAAATPRRSGGSASASPAASPSKAAIRRLSLLGGFAPCPDDGCDSDCEVRTRLQPEL